MELKGGTNNKIKHVEHTGSVKCIYVQNFCEVARCKWKSDWMDIRNGGRTKGRQKITTVK